MPGGQGRGRGGGWRWRGCSRRMVRFLDPALLLLLHRGRAHGYTLLEQLTEFGLANLNPSVVYRTLRDMESRGWVASTWDTEKTQGPPRRVYCITAEGDNALTQWAQDLGETRDLIDHFVTAYQQHMAEGEGEYH
jgi:PadR family transcriptional regulator PadR